MRPAWADAPQATLDRLREALARAGFDEARLTAAAIGARAGATDDTWVVRAQAHEGALATLVTLWMVGAATSAREAAAALAPATPAELVAAGLLASDGGDRVRATISLSPYRHLLVAADRATASLGEPRDAVPGVNPASRLLARSTVRASAGSALDLGTGNGMQALAVALHARDVLATDVNPRALHHAAFSARLNAITNIAFAEGSWFDPAGERHFDLIVANPPFVVSPDAELTYRDSGLKPGELSATLLREAASRLTPGGFAHVTTEWGVHDASDWQEVPSAWAAETGCDALVLLLGLSDPIDHAVMWNHRLLAVAPDRFEAAVERWTRHHREHGFVRLATATIILRRRDATGPPWFSALELAEPPTAEAGDHVLRVFAGEDLVRGARADTGGLLRERLAPVEGLALEQVLTTREGRWRQRPARLRLTPGLGLEGRVDPAVLDVIFALDGRRSAGEVVHTVATRRGEDASDLQTLALAQLPGLVRRGLLSAPP